MSSLVTASPPLFRTPLLVTRGHENHPGQGGNQIRSQTSPGDSGSRVCAESEDCAVVMSPRGDCVPETVWQLRRH